MGEAMSADDKTTGPAGEAGFIRRWWNWFWRPASTVALGVLVIGGVVGGILFWGGFHWALEVTNTEQFCISCHEMKKNVYAEYRSTIHYANRSGVRASCPDCHVPKEWGYKLMRKIQASNELYHHVLGTVSTPEKFDHKRLELATHEWARMKGSDSRECRNCHKFDYMDYAQQEPRASKTHQAGMTEGKTCIDCHRGIAHKLPPKANEAYQKLVESLEHNDARKLTDYLAGIAPAAEAAPVVRPAR